MRKSKESFINRYFFKILLSLFIFISCIICFPLEYVNADEKDTLEEVWCPIDSKEYNFTINNTWDTSGYIEYIDFQDSYIKNTSLGENYSIEEANSKGIINNYKVEVFLNDNKFGNKKIFSGKLNDLINTKVEVKNIYMNLDTSIGFKIKIIDENKNINEEVVEKYTYIFSPKAYKSTLRDEDYERINKIEHNKDSIIKSGIIKTEDENYIKSVILAVVIVISMEIMVIMIKRRNIFK